MVDPDDEGLLSMSLAVSSMGGVGTCTCICAVEKRAWAGGEGVTLKTDEEAVGELAEPCTWGCAAASKGRPSERIKRWEGVREADAESTEEAEGESERMGVGNEDIGGIGGSTVGVVPMAGLQLIHALNLPNISAKEVWRVVMPICNGAILLARS